MRERRGRPPDQRHRMTNCAKPGACQHTAFGGAGSKRGGLSLALKEGEFPPLWGDNEAWNDFEAEIEFQQAEVAT